MDPGSLEKKLNPKGTLRIEYEETAVQIGGDSIVVSNHGGHQLDGAPATSEVLPEIICKVAGRCEVLIDWVLHLAKIFFADLLWVPKAS